VAVFGVVDTVLLRPLPYPDADRLALVETRIIRDGAVVGRAGAQDGRTWEILGAGVEQVDLAVFSSWSSGANLVATVPAAESPEPAEAGPWVKHLELQKVGAGFFRVLGSPPLFGREWSPEEDVPGGPALTILGHQLWQDLYHGDPEVIGKTLNLRGEPHEIVGVMPRGFRTSAGADLWVPLRPSVEGEGEGTNYAILARLPPGLSWPVAEAEIRAAGAAAMGGLRSPEGTERQMGLEPLQQQMTAGVRQRLLGAWVAVGLVLAVVCINVAGLLLASGARRRRELATRMALGGGRDAILRQLLTESALLSGLGGAVGVAVAMLGARLLQDLAAAPLGLWQPISLDTRFLAMAGALSALTVLGSGLYPALSASRSALRLAQDAGGTRVAGGFGSLARRGLVVAQLALVATLLVAAGLVVRTLHHYEGLEPGFEPEGLVAATVSLQDARYASTAEVHRLLESVAERLRQDPEIRSAAAGLSLPYERPLNMVVRLPGEDEELLAHTIYATPGYFETLGLPVQGGRTLEPRDRSDSEPVAWINRTFVKTYLGDRNAVGTQIRLAGRSWTIAGIVGDTQQRPGWGKDERLASRATIYVPSSQASDGFLQLVHGWFQPSWIARAAVPGVDVAGRIRTAIAAVDPHLPVAETRTLESVRDQMLARERFQAALLSAAGALTLLLAAVGLGGLIASSVTERRRELGIRMALGATSGRALRSAILPGLALAGSGLAIGLPVAAAAAHTLRSVLVGVGALDPMTYLGVSALLLGVATLSSLLPALGILRLDPATTLRSE
ncbi:MAG: ADOP family duplicated permease, partial [Holophagales bacterium]|nr:ADOP family duplicated permease [Holophagales bacterium]